MLARTLLQFALLIALIFTPICGMGGAAKAAPVGAQAAAEGHATMADPSHCADMGGSEQGDHSKSGAGFDCRMGCTGILAPTPLVTKAQFVVGAPQRVPFVVPTPGRSPAIEPPPPRLS